MKDKAFYLKHIVEEEYRQRMSLLLDKIFLSIKNFTVEATDFFDPYEQLLAQSILNRFDLEYKITDGIDFGEKKIIIMYPESLKYNDIEISEFISPIFIDSGQTLNHSDYLGAVMNQGLERAKIGDLFAVENGCYIILHKYISDFLVLNLKKVARYNVNVRNCEFSEIRRIEENWSPKTVTCSSLRIDVLIKELLNLSRTDADTLIKKGFVKADFRPVRDRAEVLKGNELLSVRGYGRIKLEEVLGETKKGRIRLSASFLN